jgi:hypothetical protein
MSIRTEIRERLEHCPCALEILRMLARHLETQASQQWATALAAPPDQTEAIRSRVTGLIAAKHEINLILQSEDNHNDG